MTLPTERTGGGGLSITSAKSLVYGYPKVGKSTLAATIDPGHTLFLATEPGQDALDIFRQPINTWEEFRAIGADLATADHSFKLLVVDTVDELLRLCKEDVLGKMAEKAGMKGFVHPSDFEYGKGWDAVSDEFRLRVAKLCNLGMGVMFISHVNEAKMKKPNGAEYTKISPDVGVKSARKWLVGFVDLIAYAHILETSDGERRLLRLAPTETVEAGGRIEQGQDLPELINLSADELASALRPEPVKA